MVTLLAGVLPVGQGRGQLCLSQPSPEGAHGPWGSHSTAGPWAGRSARETPPSSEMVGGRTGPTGSRDLLRAGSGGRAARGDTGRALGPLLPLRPRGPVGPRPHPGAPAPRQILRLSIFLFQDSGPNKVSRPLGLQGGIVRPHGRGARRPLPAEVRATSFTRVCARSLRAPLRARPCRATAGLRGPRRGRGGRRQAGDGKITIVTRRGEACGGDDGL